MNIHAPNFDYKNLENLIALTRTRPSLTEGESGLLAVASNVLERAQQGADYETVNALLAMAERIRGIAYRRRQNVVNFPGRFHKQISAVAPVLKRRHWDSRRAA
jgi:hypothetical protein